MNKYQEALDRISEGTTIQHFATTDEDGYSNFDDYDEYIKPDESDIATLQELVDKETPKKPLPPKDTFFLHQCPNCKVDFIGSSIVRCQCGQKIDCSENE